MTSLKTVFLCLFMCGFNVLLNAQHEYTEPDVSSNGKHLVFCSNEMSENALFTSNSDGTNKTLLVDLDGYESTPNWSPNGKKITFYLMNKDGKSDAYIINSDGSDLKKINHDKLINPGFVTWKNNNTLILSSGNFPMSNIYEFNISKNSIKQLTDEKGVNYYPDINKNLLTFCKLYRDNSGTHTSIYVKNLKTKILEKLSDHGEAPIFNKEASKIIYQGKLNKYDVTGLRIIDLKTKTNIALTSNKELSELPDMDFKRKFVYYQRKVGGRFSIWRINIDGTNNTKIIGE